MLTAPFWRRNTEKGNDRARARARAGAKLSLSLSIRDFHICISVHLASFLESTNRERAAFDRACGRGCCWWSSRARNNCCSYFHFHVHSEAQAGWIDGRVAPRAKIANSATPTAQNRFKPLIRRWLTPVPSLAHNRTAAAPRLSNRTSKPRHISQLRCSGPHTLPAPRRVGSV